MNERNNCVLVIVFNPAIFNFFLVLFFQCRRHLLHSFLYVVRWMQRAETGDVSERVGVKSASLVCLRQTPNGAGTPCAERGYGRAVRREDPSMSPASTSPKMILNK